MNSEKRVRRGGVVAPGTYRMVGCHHCGGKGWLVGADPDDDVQCNPCGGGGRLVAYPSGTLASYPSGPLQGRLTAAEVAALPPLCTPSYAVAAHSTQEDSHAG